MERDSQFAEREAAGVGRSQTDLLADFIDQKYRVLEQLRELARRQSDLIAQGEIAKLLEVLSAKQRLLSDLQQLERRLDPFRGQDPASRRWRSFADQLRSRQTAERCESLLSEIMLVEKQCECDLIRRRDEAAARLQGAHTAAQARTAYTQPPQPNTRQLDLTSDT